MIADALIDGFIRDLHRRYLDFSENEDEPEAPKPSAERRYLLYLYVPFCQVLCPFCIFHKTLFDETRTRRYFDALRQEIISAGDAGFRFGDVSIGGGTPTVIIEELADTLALLRERHTLGTLSIETNADQLAADRVGALEALGIDRLSVGVETFDDALLGHLSRRDAFGGGEAMLSRLRAASGRFGTLNADMLFNLPGQSETGLRRDLAILTDEIGIDQVSYFPVMTTDRARATMNKAIGDVDYGREKRFYEIVAEHMLSAGYHRSSAWCFSREADAAKECIVEHDEYLALGSGAYSYIRGRVYASTHSIDGYIARVAAGRPGIVRERRLTGDERVKYYLMMRLFSGTLDLNVAERDVIRGFERRLSKEIRALRLFGAVRRNGRRLELTERGQYLWVVIMRAFFTRVNELRLPASL